MVGRRSLLLAGLALPVSAYGQCVTDRFAVDACRGGVRNTASLPPGATLDLSFMIPGTFDPMITFTRASTGTYFDSTGTMQTAAINALRWDYDPVLLQLRGLLLEDQRTNLLLKQHHGWCCRRDAGNHADKLVVGLWRDDTVGTQSVGTVTEGAGLLTLCVLWRRPWGRRSCWFPKPGISSPPSMDRRGAPRPTGGRSRAPDVPAGSFAERSHRRQGVVKDNTLTLTVTDVLSSCGATTSWRPAISRLHGSAQRDGRGHAKHRSVARSPSAQHGIHFTLRMGARRQLVCRNWIISDSIRRRLAFHGRRFHPHRRMVQRRRIAPCAEFMVAQSRNPVAFQLGWRGVMSFASGRSVPAVPLFPRLHEMREHQHARRLAGQAKICRHETVAAVASVATMTVGY